MTMSRRSLLKLFGLAPIAVPAAMQALTAETVAGVEFGEFITGDAVMFSFDDPGCSYPEFVSQLQDKIARSLYIPYEQLVADFAPSRSYGADINADGDAI